MRPALGSLISAGYQHGSWQPVRQSLEEKDQLILGKGPGHLRCNIELLLQLTCDYIRAHRPEL